MELYSFTQYDDEPRHEAWERYKELLRKFPDHGIPKQMQIHSFYKGLTSIARTLLDTSARGAIMKKNEDETYELLEDMDANKYLWSSERLTPLKIVIEIHEVDATTKLIAYVTL